MITIDFRNSHLQYQKFSNISEEIDFMEVYLKKSEFVSKVKELEKAVQKDFPTWQDKLENLYLVWNEVLKCDECPNIISYKFEKKGSEDEYDVYILTEDNLKYREVFYKTLLRMREEYSQKQLIA